MSKVSVIGLGVVGLPAALLFARAGHKVLGVDTDENLVDLLNKGLLPSRVQEQELQQLLKNSRVKQNLRVQLTAEEADVFLIAVPTPLDQSKNKADLSSVKKASELIVPYLKKGDLVIVESTIPPLTCRNFVTPILEKSNLKVGEDIFLAHCPERILPGDIYKEIINNDRIVGGVNRKSSEKAEKLYLSFSKGNIYKTDDVTAELCKLMENAYRDINIAIANEFASVADNLGVDSKEAISLANKHPRVNILNPSIGVGGHCIPIDPWFIHQVDPKNSKLISISRKINDKVPYKIARKIKEDLKGIRKPKIVAIGASYKPNTADIRESPALEVVKILKKMGIGVFHFDPLVEGLKYPKSLLDECLGKDLLVILVPHKIVLNELSNSREKLKEVLSTHTILQF